MGNSTKTPARSASSAKKRPSGPARPAQPTRRPAQRPAAPAARKAKAAPLTRKGPPPQFDGEESGVGYGPGYEDDGDDEDRYGDQYDDEDEYGDDGEEYEDDEEDEDPAPPTRLRRAPRPNTMPPVSVADKLAANMPLGYADVSATKSDGTPLEPMKKREEYTGASGGDIFPLPSGKGAVKVQPASLLALVTMEEHEGGLPNSLRAVAQEMFGFGEGGKRQPQPRNRAEARAQGERHGQMPGQQGKGDDDAAFARVIQHFACALVSVPGYLRWVTKRPEDCADDEVSIRNVQDVDQVGVVMWALRGQTALMPFREESGVRQSGDGRKNVPSAAQ